MPLLRQDKIRFGLTRRRNTGAIGTAIELIGGAVAAGWPFERGLNLRPCAVICPGVARTYSNNGGRCSDAWRRCRVQRREQSFRSPQPGRAGCLGRWFDRRRFADCRSRCQGRFISNILEQLNPQGVTRRQVARAVTESEQTPDEIATALQQAEAEGQGNFTLADVLGNSGQRMLSSVARAPGEGRTNAVNTLENRQAGQGRRISNALSKGFEAPKTGAQVECRLIEARNEAADREFGAIREDANPVDLTHAIARTVETLTPGVNQVVSQPSNIAHDSIETALQRFHDRMTDGQSKLSDFTAVQRLRDDLSDAVQSAQRSGYGNRARLLRGVLREVDRAMENASQGYLAANQRFAQATRNIESVQAGCDAAMRRRTENTIPA